MVQIAGRCPAFFSERSKRICSFSRSLRENEPKEGRYPQGSLNVVDSCHDSAKQASLMALTAPRVQRGMQPLLLSLF